MYYYEDTKIRRRNIYLYDILDEIKDLNIDMIITTIKEIIEKVKKKKTDCPLFYINTTLFNETDEFSARIQAQMNYDLFEDKSKDKPKKVWKTRFYNLNKDQINIAKSSPRLLLIRKEEKYSNDPKMQMIKHKN